MPTFTHEEIQTLQDALNMAIASNKRMMNSKPKFHTIFQNIDNELNALKAKVATPDKNK